MTKLLFAFSIVFSLFTSCVSSPYYQKSESIPNNKWAIDFKPGFVIDIEDTGIYYNTDFIIRHTNNYRYANIWLNVLVKGPGQKSFTKTRIEIPLATAQGQWLGQGMGEIFEQRRMIVLNHDEMPITDNLISVSEESFKQLFRKKGRYEIRLEQNMREKALSDVLHVGLRIEKSSKRAVNKPKPLS